MTTGADTGIGCAVAIAYAREGADVLVSYLDEHEDAEQTARHVEEAGRPAGRTGTRRPVRLAALPRRHRQGRRGARPRRRARHQRGIPTTRESLEEIPHEEWDHTLATNLSAMFHACKAAVPHMGAGVVDHRQLVAELPTCSQPDARAVRRRQSRHRLAQLLGEPGIRVNSLAPGPVWTPLIPSTTGPENVESFGSNTPLGRPGQPAELAPVRVLLASDEASHVSGSRVAVTGGRPIP